MSPQRETNEQDRRKNNVQKKQKFVTNEKIAAQCSIYKKIDSIMRKRETANAIEEVGGSAEIEDESPLITVKSKTKEIHFDHQSKIKFPIVYRANVNDENSQQSLIEQQKNQVKLAKVKHGVKYSIQTNDCAQDYLWHGQNTSSKGKTHARFWIQNPNGIKLHTKFKQFRGDLEAFRKHKVDFLAIPESKLNAQNSYVHEYVPLLVQRHYPGSFLNISNTPGFGKADVRQNGGVMSIAMNKLVGTYAGKGRDSGGRYNWISFRGKNFFLKVYTLYRVNRDDEKNAGTSSAWTEQLLWMKWQQKEIDGTQNQTIENQQIAQTERPAPDPREEVMRSLAQNIQEDLRKGDQVIVMGDVNECCFTGKFNAKMEELGLSNIASPYVYRNKKLRSQNRGSKVIDGAWATSLVRKHAVKAGYAPFDEGFMSDHRGFFFDIDISTMLKQRNIILEPSPYRRLQSQIPARANKYIATLKSLWHHHKMDRKCNSIKEYAKSDKPDAELLTTRLNNVDNEISQILRCSEKGCCRVGRQATRDWSPKLARLIKLERQKAKDLKNLKRCQLKEATATRTLQIKFDFQELKSIRKELKKAMESSEELRKIHIKELAEEKIKLNPNKDYQKEVKQLLHIEEQRRVAKAIRRVHKPCHKTGLKSILVPAKESYGEKQNEQDFDHMDFDTIWEKVNTGNWKHINQWEQLDNVTVIEDIMLKCMQKHFQQAHGTPLTSTHWKKKLQNQDFVEKIRKGDLSELEGEAEPIVEYFQEIHNDASTAQANPIEYSFEQWKSYIQNVKEKTSTSPSGRHYGHWKTILMYAPSIFAKLYDITSIAMAHEIMLERWKKTVTILIEKHPGKPYVHRTRPLHIVEPEVNAIAKLVWAKKLMQAAER